MEPRFFFVRIQKMYDGMEDTLFAVFQDTQELDEGKTDEQVIWEYAADFYERKDENFEPYNPIADESPDMSERFEEDEFVWWIDRFERINETEYDRLNDLLYSYKAQD